MLVFTNRTIGSGNTDSAFGSAFTPGATRLGFATVTPTAKGKSWKLADIQPEADDAAILGALQPLFSGKRPVLVYLHGNNNTPASCFTRCAVLESMYGLEVVGFSWASEGYLPDGTELAGAENDNPGDEQELRKVTAENRTDGAIQKKARRYRQAKNNAQDSVDALARFLRLLGIARLQANAQPYSLVVHSLGGHFLQYTLDIEAATEALGTAHNVALVAPCVRASGHRDWLGKIRPKGQVFVTYNNGDSVLLGAFFVDGRQTKLGADPGPELLQSDTVRYVCFSNSKVGLGGHAYFVYDKLPKITVKLFSRIFGSERDIRPDEYPRQVYAIGCDEDGLTCYVGLPSTHDGG